MNKLQAALEIVRLLIDIGKAFAWPIVTLLIAASYKPEITDLLKKLKPKKVSLFGNEVELVDQIAESQEEENIPVTPTEATRSETELQEENKRLKEDLLFENSYSVSFGSQLELLDMLKIRGAGGMSLVDVAAFYEKVKTERWTKVSHWTLENYMKFLEARNFIEKYISGTAVYYKITDLGIKFIDFIDERGYPRQIRPL